MHISLFQTWNKIRCVCDTRQSEGPISSKRSGVWKFFEIVEGDNSKALCKVCQEEGACISWGGKQSKLTNLQNHLRKHPKNFLELAANDKEQRTDRDDIAFEKTNKSRNKCLLYNIHHEPFSFHSASNTLISIVYISIILFATCKTAWGLVTNNILIISMCRLIGFSNRLFSWSTHL